MTFILNHLSTLIVMLILLSCSAMFSGGETALFSLKVNQLNYLRSHGGWLNLLILDLRKNREQLIYSILLGNTIVNISFFSFGATMAFEVERDYPGFGMGVIVSLTSLFMVIIFGEMLPKAIAGSEQIRIAQLVAAPLSVLHRISLPLRRILEITTQVVERIMKLKHAPEKEVKAEELELLVEVSHREGVITHREEDLIQRILHLPQVRVAEVMTPRVDFVALTSNSTIQQVIDLSAQKKHRRIIIYKQDPDHPQGWVDSRLLILNYSDYNVQLPDADIHPFWIISRYDFIDKTMIAMKETQHPLSLVVDEYGDAAGILTIKDIGEALLGSQEETQAVVPDITASNDAKSYLVAGDLNIRHWNRFFGEEYFPTIHGIVTLGGLITAQLGTTPVVGDKIVLDNLQLEVTKTERHRVKQVRIILKKQESPHA